MPLLILRIIQFTAWVETLKPEFSPKLLLMFLIGLYSTLHGHPVPPTDINRRKGWSAALRNKWGKHPGFDKELEALLKEFENSQPDTSHHRLYPRGWIDLPYGLEAHLNVWCWDQLCQANEYLPIPLHDIFNHVETIRIKYNLPPLVWPKKTVAAGKPEGAHLLEIIATLDVIIQELESKLPPGNPQYLNNNAVVTDLEDLEHTKQDVQNMLLMIGQFRKFVEDTLEYPFVKKFLASPLRTRTQRDKINDYCASYVELATYGKAKPVSIILRAFSKYWDTLENPVNRENQNH